MADDNQLPTREAILAEARRCFAQQGYEGTSLNDIAAGVGIKRASVLHHFPSKEAIYQEVFNTTLAQWISIIMAETEVHRDDADRGWPYVETIIRAGFRFFQENPDFVTIVRREALDRKSRLGIDLGVAIRPMFQQASNYFRREMDAGTYRRLDPEQLLLTGYGAMFSYFSDLPLIEGLLDRDPLEDQLLEERLAHILALFRVALQPE